MKVKRYKKLNKNLNFYINNFGFRQPYQLLVDGTFCYAALNNQVNIADNIPRYLHGDIKLLTTQCAIIEMENLGSKLGGALLILKKYVLHKCDHEGKPISGASCMMSMLGKVNDKHYIIATQDRELQDKVRFIPGVPLLYLHSKAPVLEKPSEVSVKATKDRLAGIAAIENRTIDRLKQKNGIVESETTIKPRKKRRKGPNPLSCKKKKKPIMQNAGIKKVEGKPEIEKRKRKKIRIPDHVKAEFESK